ncbi:hypothetical protein [Gemmata sp.]|uniref:hypothetical protein n=1 Tax=Gemmata sp. TaxID=1914242 RepID=UPI003F70959B
MPRHAGLAALVAIALSGPSAATAQEPASYQRLRAALHELRDARGTLTDVADEAPNPLKDRALASTQEAINSIKGILAVKDVKNFRGVERTPDYYKRYPDHPRLRAALADLREARDELRAAKADFGGLKDKALDDIDVAVGDIISLIRSHARPRP